jgi:hypothetical protein
LGYPLKRICALTLLATFTAGPSARWLCRHSCTATQAAAVTEECHESGGAGPAIVTGHVCDHALPAALTAKRSEPASHLVAWIPVAFPADRSRPWPRLSKAAFVAPDTSPPAASLAAPLRI